MLLLFLIFCYPGIVLELQSYGCLSLWVVCCSETPDLLTSSMLAEIFAVPYRSVQSGAFPYYRKGWTNLHDNLYEWLLEKNVEKALLKVPFRLLWFILFYFLQVARAKFFISISWCFRKTSKDFTKILQCNDREIRTITHFFKHDIFTVHCYCAFVFYTAFFRICNPEIWNLI